MNDVAGQAIYAAIEDLSKVLKTFGGELQEVVVSQRSFDQLSLFIAPKCKYPDETLRGFVEIRLWGHVKVRPPER